MAEEAHYKYDSEIELKKPEAKNAVHSDTNPQVPIRVDVKDVKFLVPVEIDFEIVNTITDEVVGDPVKITGGVNIPKEELSLHKKFPEQVAEQIRKSVFEFIWDSSARPESQYEANEDVYEQAERAKVEHDTLHEENI